MVHLKLTGDGPTASGYELSIDGHDITRSTRAVDVSLSVDEINTATVEIYVDKLDIDADVEGKLIDITPSPERTSFASRFREWIGR